VFTLLTGVPAPSKAEPTGFVPSEPMFTSYEAAAPSFPFPPSEAANLEYSILSTILGNSPESGTSAGSPGAPAASQAHSHVAAATPASNTYAPQQSPTSMVNGAWPGSNNGYAEQQSSNSTAAPQSGYIAPSSYQMPVPPNGVSTSQVQDTQYQEYPTNQQQPSSLGNYAGQPSQAPVQHVSPSSVQLVPRPSAVPTTRSSSTTLIDRTISTGTASWAGPAPSEVGYHDGTSVYKSVTKPYDYTEGYHFLMKHLPVRCVIRLPIGTISVFT
jgi:hypothetical protein